MFIQRIFDSASKLVTRAPLYNCRFLTVKMSSKTIGTHDGVFHCDEILACFLLRQLSEWKDCKIIRSRKPDVLSSCDILIDVGGEYNVKKLKFDHHQRGFTHTLSSIRADCPNKFILLSSAGLIYAHYGEEVIRNLNPNLKMNESDWFVVYKHIYDKFIEEIDGIDNGIPLSDGELKYQIRSHFSARVGRLNPEWNDPESKDPDQLFMDAYKVVGDEFKQILQLTLKYWWPAREIVRESIENRFKVHPSGAIMLLEKLCPWMHHLFEIEKDLQLGQTLKFIIFKDDCWRVRAIPISADSFVCRVFLQENWRGLRNDALSAASGIPDGVFCHANGFIGGNNTKEGAIEMALKSLPVSNRDGKLI